ncbi:hypothetical protein, partial [Klebsiella michiganensis]|uniref:hypothetical protein n=1 Tax=Klebsiella michiganensis TaxID=1134687 RepID=UPI0019543EA1
MSRLARLSALAVLAAGLDLSVPAGVSAQQNAARDAAKMSSVKTSPKLGLGRPALPEEIKAW